MVALHDQDVEVDALGKRLRVKLADVRKTSRGPAPQARAKARVNVQYPARDHIQTAAELNVIGCTVDEAIGRTEKFLDEALMADQRTVRLIHGHGTGQLRRATGGLSAGLTRWSPASSRRRPTTAAAG